MKYVIDRFEENFAVCEDEQGNMVSIERNKITGTAAEGDILIQKLNGYVVDEKETIKRKKSIKSLAEELWTD